MVNLGDSNPVSLGGLGAAASEPLPTFLVSTQASVTALESNNNGSGSGSGSGSAELSGGATLSLGPSDPVMGSSGKLHEHAGGGPLKVLSPLPLAQHAAASPGVDIGHHRDQLGSPKSPVNILDMATRDIRPGSHEEKQNNEVGPDELKMCPPSGHNSTPRSSSSSDGGGGGFPYLSPYASCMATAAMWHSLHHQQPQQRRTHHLAASEGARRAPNNGRVPWNLAGLVGHFQPTTNPSPGPVGVAGAPPGPGVPGSDPGLNHHHLHTAATPHYPHHYAAGPPPPPPPAPAAPPGPPVSSQAYPHLLPGQVDPTAPWMVPTEPNLGGMDAAAAAAAMNPGMYYPHHPAVASSAATSSPGAITSVTSPTSAITTPTPGAPPTTASGSNPDLPLSTPTSAGGPAAPPASGYPPQSGTATSASLEASDMMHSLQHYFEEGASGANSSSVAPGGASSGWVDPNQDLSSGHHHTLSEPPYQDYAIGRKKKIIKEWNTKNAESAAARSAAAASVYSADLFYSPHSYIKDEPLRTAAAAADYHSSYAAGQAAYAAYQEAALASLPYAHMAMAGTPSATITPAAATAAAHDPHSAAAAAAVAVANPGLGGGAAVPGSSPAAPGTNGPGRPKKDRKRKNASKSGSGSSADGSGGSPYASGLPPGHAGLSRDERKALAMGLPIPVTDIINLPMDEFNDLLSKHELTEEQLTLCRDIRRRGKNKVAARNCRKRKIDQIKQLEDDVTRIRCRKTELVNEHEKLVGQRNHWSDLVKRLHDHVLKELGHDPDHWQLQMDIHRQVHILPRTQHDDLDPHKVSRPYHYAPSVGTPVMEQTHNPTN